MVPLAVIVNLLPTTAIGCMQKPGKGAQLILYAIMQYKLCPLSPSRDRRPVGGVTAIDRTAIPATGWSPAGPAGSLGPRVIGPAVGRRAMKSGQFSASSNGPAGVPCRRSTGFDTRSARHHPRGDGSGRRVRRRDGDIDTIAGPVELRPAVPSTREAPRRAQAGMPVPRGRRVRTARGRSDLGRLWLCRLRGMTGRSHSVTGSRRWRGCP